jgi:hypothetical protein
MKQIKAEISRKNHNCLLFYFILIKNLNGLLFVRIVFFTLVKKNTYNTLALFIGIIASLIQ